MKYNLVFLSVVFLIVIFLGGIFIKTGIEYFTTPDPVIDAIDNLKKKFLELQITATNAKKTVIVTRDGNTPVATLINTEYQHLTTLEETYKSLSGSANPSAIKGMQKSLNKSVIAYNYINTYLSLNLPILKNNIIAKPKNPGRKSISGQNINRQKKLSGKSLSLKSRDIKKHHSIETHAIKNSIINDLVKRFNLKDSSRKARSGKARSGKARSGKGRSGKGRSGKGRSGNKNRK